MAQGGRRTPGWLLTARETWAGRGIGSPAGTTVPGLASLVMAARVAQSGGSMGPVGVSGGGAGAAGGFGCPAAAEGRSHSGGGGRSSKGGEEAVGSVVKGGTLGCAGEGAEADGPGGVIGGWGRG